MGTTDLTVNIPVPNPNDYSNPRVAINALDGFSTASPMSTGFSVPIKPSSVSAGSSVRVFQVTLTGPGGGVTGITNELQPNVEYVTALPSSDSSGRTLAIVPTKPLKQLTSYMVVLTNGITDNRGNDATPDQTYFLTKRTSGAGMGLAITRRLLDVVQGRIWLESAKGQGSAFHLAMPVRLAA